MLYKCLAFQSHIFTRIIIVLLKVFLICGPCSGLEQRNARILKKKIQIIEAPAGTIAGNIRQIFNLNVFTFLGIPYAQPPIGKRRFAKPQSIEKWHGTFYANHKPLACMQYSRIPQPWNYNGNFKSEDCLYLNVWTPTQVDLKLPVMVWIHGGGFVAGATRMDEYDGSILSAFGQVVVVSMDYRLGIFGFFNAGIAEAPGNVGLLDQLLALKWIKENIQSFGGDPERITLAGQSAGGMSVGFHVVSPLSRGLFQKAIMMSGVAIYPDVFVSYNSSINRSDVLSQPVGCSNEIFNLKTNPERVVNCLKKIDALQLAKLVVNHTDKFPMYVAPCFGDEFLPESPINVLQSNNFQSTLRITQSNDFQSPLEALKWSYSHSPVKTKKSNDIQSEIQQSNDFQSLIKALQDSSFKYTFNSLQSNDFQSPIKTLRSNDIRMPVLLGVTQNEGDIFLEKIRSDLISLNKNPILNLTQAKSVIKNIFIQRVETDDIFDFYVNNINTNSSIALAQALSDMISDFYWYCPALYTASKLEPSYSYVFAQQNVHNNNAPWVGVLHNSEIQYMFGLPFQKFSDYTNDDRVISMDFMDKWLNFIKNGHPLREDVWPQFTPGDPKVYQLNSEDEGLKAFPRKEACQFLMPYILKELYDA